MARSQSQLQLLGLLLLVAAAAITITASARDVSPNKPAPIKIYPSCSKTLMPKRCSVMLSTLSKTLADTKAAIDGPQFAAGKLKSDPCISGCAKVLGEAASKASAAAAAAGGGGDAISQLKDYLYPLVISNDGPIGPCECTCPDEGRCSSRDEAEAVQNLGAATEAMRDMASLLDSMSFDDDQLTDEEKRAKVEPMEKSMDSGLLHVSCGLTKEPQKCVDELTALAKAMRGGRTATTESGLARGAPSRLTGRVSDCDLAMTNVEDKIAVAAGTVVDLAQIRDDIRSYLQGDGKEPPRCKFSCPPPPEKPCSAKETALVDALKGVLDAWVAAEKFLTELLSPK
jgi:hypothetical protein